MSSFPQTATLKTKLRCSSLVTRRLPEAFLTILYCFCFVSCPVQGSHGGRSCHTLFPNEEGVITSPDFNSGLHYPHNVMCIYDILRSQEAVCGISLKFDFFTMEAADSHDGFCKKDWLSIDSCVPEGGSRFCGNMTGALYEYPFQLHADAFRLIFRSDNFTSGPGFKISYKLLKDCRHGLYWDPPVSIIPGVYPANIPCFTQVTEAKGTINTPFFPYPYPNMTDCVFEFIRESPFVCGVRMKVLSFELDKAIETPLGGACLDFFHAPGCGFLCGSLRFLWTAKYQPGATSLKFHFHSDEKTERSGFQIAFEQVYDCSSHSLAPPSYYA